MDFYVKVLAAIRRMARNMRVDSRSTIVSSTLMRDVDRGRRWYRATVLDIDALELIRIRTVAQYSITDRLG